MAKKAANADPKKPVPLAWDQEDAAIWAACSCLSDEGTPFMWRIFVKDDGQFSIEDSSPEIFDKRKHSGTMATFEAAKNVCQSLDNGLRIALASRKE